VTATTTANATATATTPPATATTTATNTAIALATTTDKKVEGNVWVTGQWLVVAGGGAAGDGRSPCLYQNADFL
jgi:hypothetical protein